MKTRKAHTKRNPHTSKRKSLASRVLEKRRNRKDATRNARQEATIEKASALRPHLRPVAIDAAAVATALAVDMDPTVGMVTGGVAAGVLAISTGLGALSAAQRRCSWWHLAGASVWTGAASAFGVTTVPVLLAGGVAAVAAQTSWAQALGSDAPKTTGRVDRTVAERWNDPETGVLAKAGAAGARMIGHRTVHNRDSLAIGDEYVVDLSGSTTLADTMRERGPQIGHHMPGKVRPKSVQVIPDVEDGTKVTVRHIWISQWKKAADDPKRETAFVHPIVHILPELNDVLNAAMNRHDDPDTADQPIPEHVRAWLPWARSFADPVWIGETEDKSSFYKKNFFKGQGVRHGRYTAASGGGKTSFINSEIASLAPCRDVLIWYADISTKRGVDVKPWGGVLDWFVDNRQELVEMLKSAKAIMDRRAVEYADLGGLRTPSQCPTIKVYIDEVNAAFDEVEDLGEDLVELLDPLVRQGRAQGVQLEIIGQTAAEKGTAMRGYQDLIRAGITQNGVLKVNDERALAFALNYPENVPYDMTAAPEGVMAFESHGADVADVLRVGWIDQGDPDEGVPGLIPAIASVYAPFRPQLDEKSAPAAGSAYHNRAATTADNPFLTPVEVSISHAPVHPVTSDDDLEAQRDNITTARQWIEAIKNGDQVSFASLADALTAERDLGTTPDDRKARQETIAAEHAERTAGMDAEFDELDQAVQDFTNVALPKADFPDDDEIIAAAVEMLRRNAGRGFSTAELTKKTGKGDKACRRRLTFLANEGRAVKVGSTRDTRWYHPEYAPEVKNA